MLRVEKKIFERVVVQVITSTDLRELVDEFSSYRLFFYSILKDISKGKNSPNYPILKEIVWGTRISEQFIIEQANSILSQFVPEETTENYYEILDVSPTASTEEVRKKWLSLVKAYHPDAIGDEGLDITKKLNEAYEVLGDSAKRSRYDARYLPDMPILVVSPWVEHASKKSFYLFPLILVALVSTFYLINSNLSFRSAMKKDRVVERIEDGKRDVHLYVKQISPAKNGGEKKSAALSYPEIKGKAFVAGEFLETESLRERYQKATSSLGLPSEQQSEIETVAGTTSVSDTEEIEITGKSPEKEEVIALGEKNQTEQKIEIADKTVPEEIKGEVAAIGEKSSRSKYSGGGSKVVSYPDRKVLYSSLYSFVSEYVSAYKDRDLNRFISFFEPGAKENGIEISRAFSPYADNFSSLEILKYDVRINGISFNYKGDGASTKANFVVVFRRKDEDKTKSSSGTINWLLYRQYNGWKIKEVDYSIEDTKSLEGSKLSDALNDNS